jgi:hypothetical protein
MKQLLPWDGGSGIDERRAGRLRHAQINAQRCHRSTRSTKRSRHLGLAGASLGLIKGTFRIIIDIAYNCMTSQRALIISCP